MKHFNQHSSGGGGGGHHRYGKDENQVINSIMFEALKDAQIKLSKEECALGMERRSNDAAWKDPQIKPSKEECVLDMGQRSNDMNALLMDAQIVHRKEECVRHGAKVKLCSSEGCTNYAQRGGLCRRHSAYRSTQDESTAFGSEYEKTTATQTSTNKCASGSAPRGLERGSVPEEVTILCQEIVEV